VTLFHGNGSKENIPPINSSGNALYVYFTSDGIIAKSGFSAHITLIVSVRINVF